MKMTLKEIASASKGSYKGNGDTILTGFFTDSRMTSEGGLYCAQIGERVDGHKFVPELLRKGYTCLISEEEYFTENTILVEDTKKAMYDIAMYWRNTYIPHVKIIGVTGSVGKTTTKDMTGLVMNSEYKTFVTKGNHNSFIGVPTSLVSVEKDDEYAVLELGMSERGEIASHSRLVKPYMSVITLVGNSHIEYLGSKENIRKEKFDILVGEDPKGIILLDGDSDEEYEMRKHITNTSIFCGISERCDVRATDIVYDEEKTEFTVVWKNGSQRIVSNIRGSHYVKDALYAFAFGVLNGISPEKAAEALSTFKPYGARQRIYRTKGVTIIEDCYNASPESMKASLGVLKTFEGRKIAVLGDMLELGEKSDDFHKENALIASEIADILIFVGQKSVICSDMCKGKTVFAFDVSEKKQAASKLLSLMHDGDTILFKGSHGIALDEMICFASLNE